MEGKRSHDFLGRERLPNSREHGVTLFQNAARPSVAAAARILASFHAISSFSSPPSLFPLSPGGEGEGRGGEGKGESRLFFFLNFPSIDHRPRPPREKGHELSRKKETRESIFRAYS